MSTKNYRVVCLTDGTFTVQQKQDGEWVQVEAFGKGLQGYSQAKQYINQTNTP